ncbi:exodeoxyribonuclease VII small subunit [Patescibacteria group bacterium]|uniref:Exodeoxyribonuclease 7 small subunit n=1 Tax=candidate division WWE3 bacterium TaxID=2053526 RepID=A0A928TU99_UNCKA|nr:exodeoxyribonuclease VII small subunit [candidate division WWE3 bacterium]MCL4732940.1 exodeoxyribonuclease VII small subunit [Patescibacteria group bacterium]MDL1952851.1 exodeoxyribonuclease VII small subunit [Candidatus Uhrbacteria bacterium UHB]RIL01086.1 MAG: exodeoxyribonuclease VII small subunit [Candidatus Uhrbacteria bacterium]
MAKKKVAGDFGANFKELEDIAEWFEREEPDIDKGLAKFERAMELAAQCRDELAKAEQKVKEIRKKFGEHDTVSLD